MKRNGPAPSDETAATAWKEIMESAEKHALIVQAYGGTATLAMPDEQRKAGVRERTLAASCFDSERSGNDDETKRD